MSQISNVSVLALPLTPSELSNGEQYKPPPEKMFAVVKYRFIAERAERASCKPGECLIVAATAFHETSGEWVVAKTLGRLSRPGLVQHEYMEIRENSGTFSQDALKTFHAAGVPDVRKWKFETDEYVKKAVTLDWEGTQFLKIDRDHAQDDRKDMNSQA